MNDHPANTAARACIVAEQIGPERCLVGIDGRSGSGKTTLARALAVLLERRVEIIEVELFIGGWDALTSDIGRVAELARDLRRGHATARAWDWHEGRWGRNVWIPQTGEADVVIITGCGATSAPVREHLDLTVWIEAPEAVRRERVRARDPYDWSAHWDTWARQEEALLAQFPSNARNDLILR